MLRKTIYLSLLSLLLVACNKQEPSMNNISSSPVASITETSPNPESQGKSILLKEEERKLVSTSLAFMIAKYSKKDKNEILDQIEYLISKGDLVGSDTYLIAEYKKASALLENKANSGDYQSQRNFAYMLSNDPEIAGGNKVHGCGWYLVLLASGNKLVNKDTDKENVRIYCGNNFINDIQRKEAFTFAREKTKLIYKTTERFENFYGKDE